jgi:hypothetical protein
MQQLTMSRFAKPSQKLLQTLSGVTSGLLGLSSLGFVILQVRQRVQHEARSRTMEELSRVQTIKEKQTILYFEGFSVPEVLLWMIWTISFSALGSSCRSCCPESRSSSATGIRSTLKNQYLLRRSLSKSSTTNSVNSAERRLRIIS